MRPLIVVAGVGLEPHDLRVMSPTSCQLLYPAIWVNRTSDSLRYYYMRLTGICQPIFCKKNIMNGFKTFSLSKMGKGVYRLGKLR